MRPTFKIILFARQVKDGKRPVMFRVTYNRKSKHFSLSRYCLPTDWDEKTNRFRRAFPDYKRQNELLRTLEQRAADILFAWERENIAFDFAEFERLMFADRAGKKSAVAWEYAAGIAAALEKEGRVGYAAYFHYLASMLKAYQPTAGLSDISPAWLDAFEKWMRTKRDFGNGGLLSVLRVLRVSCNRAIKAGDMPESWQPFKGYNFARVRPESKRRAITLAEVRKLKEAPVLNEMERFALDLFMFSFYCWGMNLADIANLKRENIQDLRIEYVRQKTKRPYSINLSVPAAAIIDRYKSADSHLFPIFYDGVHITEKQKMQRRKEMRKRVNEALRAIVARIGMKAEGFTLYVARHTYATALKRANFPHALIQDVLGHSDIRITEGYLAKSDFAALDGANAAILAEIG